ncbi:MAG: SPASM domain-containing protein, partial [Woeseiaceae bacterium]|nr:SPASM domain-containing protein [Woeseiaceae bacterium]
LDDVEVTIHLRTDSLWAKQYPDYQTIRELGVYSMVIEPGVVSWRGAIREEDLPGDMFLVAGPRHQRKPCLDLCSGFTVLADGRMTLCGCMDIDGTGLPLGSIMSEDIDAHLRDGRWQKLRDGFYEGNPPEFCQGCDAYWPTG